MSAMSNSIGSNVETLYQILDGRAEALEFAIHDTSAVTDIPLAELKLKSNLLIGSINRKGKPGFPVVRIRSRSVTLSSSLPLRKVSAISWISEKIGTPMNYSIIFYIIGWILNLEAPLCFPPVW